MKRILTGLLLAVLVAPFVMGQFAECDEYFIGMVTYQIDAMTWTPENYVRPINADLQVLPVEPGKATIRQIPEVEPDHYLLELRDAGTAQAQIDAINELLAMGCEALVITPVAETNLIKDAVAAAAAKVPVILTGRRIPGLDLPFYGMDTFELGLALANNNTQTPFVIVGNRSDATQAAFIEPLEAIEPFQGFYEAATVDGKAEAAQAINDVPSLATIVVSHHKYAPGAAAAIKDATEGTDRLIQLGSVGAPEGWKDLFEQKLLHGVFAWDNYVVLQGAAVAAKVAIRDGVPAQDFHPDVLYYRSATGFNHTSYPYSQDQPNRVGRFFR